MPRASRSALYAAHHQSGGEVLLQVRIYHQNRDHRQKHLRRARRAVAHQSQILGQIAGQIGAASFPLALGTVLSKRLVDAPERLALLTFIGYFAADRRNMLSGMNASKARTGISTATASSC